MYALCCLLILRFFVENSFRCFTPFENRKRMLTIALNFVLWSWLKESNATVHRDLTKLFVLKFKLILL